MKHLARIPRSRTFSAVVAMALLCFAASPQAVTTSVSATSAVTLRAEGASKPSPVTSSTVVLDTDAVGIARSVWSAWVEDSELDPRVDLIELDFEKGMHEGAVKITGLSASPDLLSGFYAALATRGILFESAVTLLPDAERLKLLTRGVVRSTRAWGAQSRKDLLAGRAARRVPLGRIVQVLENSFDGVIRVRLDDGWIGWMREGDLSLVKESWLIAWNRRDHVLITAPKLRLYTPAGSIVAEVRAGVQLPLLGKNDKGDWRVALPDGREVIVGAQDAVDWQKFSVSEENDRRADPEAFRAAIAKTAEALATAGWSQREDGAPIVVTAFRLHDLILDEAVDRAARLSPPRLAGKQGADLRPGDLVFFGANKTPERVGIWLGGGKFVAEAPGSDKAAVLPFTGGSNEKANGGMGPFVLAERLPVEVLNNPCLLSTRSNPFHQAPPGPLSRCRLR